MQKADSLEKGILFSARLYEHIPDESITFIAVQCPYGAQ
jgi:hypothetical protein